MDYGVTKDGFVKKRYDTIYEEIQADVKSGTDIDISLNPKSYINVLLSSITDKLAAVWDVAESVYYSMFPSTSEGRNLDYACEFAGVSRSEGTPTKYYILCTGENDAIIPAGTRISSATQPKFYFTITTEQRISSTKFNKAQIVTAGNPVYGYSYQITLDGTQHSYIYEKSTYEADSAEFKLSLENGVDAPEGTDLTNATIYYKLAKSINDSGQPFTASVEFVKENDGDTYPVLSIEAELKYVNYSYSLNENLTSDSVSSIILFESEELDDIVLPADTITNIESSSNSDDFKSCTNLSSIIHGKARESDEELRQSYLSKQAYRACTTVSSILAALLVDVEDVSSVAGFENDTGSPTTIGSRVVPAHTIAIIVDGGDEGSIAETILKYKPAGIGTYAVNDEEYAEEVEVPTGNNSSITIRFSRPVHINVHLDVIIEANPDEAISLNYTDLTKQAITEYTDGLMSGQNVIIQKAITNINNLVSGIAYVGIVATWTVSEETTTTDDDGNIITTSTEIPYESKRYITVDAWHKAWFEKDDGSLDITVYMYDTNNVLWKSQISCSHLNEKSES